jgi:hypothetical protein
MDKRIIEYMENWINLKFVHHMKLKKIIFNFYLKGVLVNGTVKVSFT